MADNKKTCINCKHKRIVGGVYLCAFSPMYMSTRNSQTQLINHKLEECRKVKINKSGKCYNYENWECLSKNPSKKEVIKNVGSLCKSSVLKTKSLLSNIKIKRV